MRKKRHPQRYFNWAQGSSSKIVRQYVEATIHWPTDSSLLWDSWRVLYQLLKKVKKLHLFITRYVSSKDKKRQRKVPGRGSGLEGLGAMLPVVLMALPTRGQEEISCGGEVWNVCPPKRLLYNKIHGVVFLMNFSRQIFRSRGL